MKTCVLAFSGGLDTSFCVPRLAGAGLGRAYRLRQHRRRHGRRSARASRARPRRSARPGITTVDAAPGRVRSLRPLPDPGQRAPGRGLSPLAWPPSGPSRPSRSIEVARRDRGHARWPTAPPAPATTRSGSTSRSGCSRPTSRSSPPSATRGLQRDQAIAYLEARRLPVPAEGRRLLASTAGSGAPPGAAAGPTTPGPGRRPSCSTRPPTRPRRAEIVLGWERGVPVSLDGDAARRAGADPAARRPGASRTASAAASTSARPRSASRAASVSRPGPRCCSSPRTASWRSWCSPSGRASGRTSWRRFYGDRLHEGQYFDPALRDIEALITSSQHRVTGETRVRLAPGRFQVVGARSPYSMMDRECRHLRRGEPALDRRRRPRPSAGSRPFRRCWPSGRSRSASTAEIERRVAAASPRRRNRFFHCRGTSSW